MAQDLSTGKSVCIVAVLMGCIAILWPSIFHPMFKSSIFPSEDVGNVFKESKQRPHLGLMAWHPAFRKLGRSIPHPHAQHKLQKDRSSPPPPVISAEKPPVPGLRPPMGGGGQVPPQKDGSPMGVLMPLYTVGIIMFFIYTMTKLVCQKRDSTYQNIHDPEFNRLGFRNHTKKSEESVDGERKNNISANALNLGWQENDIRDIEISRLRERLAETEATMERIIKQMNWVSRSVSSPLNENSNSDENNSGNPVVKGLMEPRTVTKEFEQKRIIVESSPSSARNDEVNSLIPVEMKKKGENCSNEPPWKHSSVDSMNKNLTTKSVHQEIIEDDDTNSRDLDDKSPILLESQVPLDVISNDSNQEVSSDKKKDEDDELGSDEDEEKFPGRNSQQKNFNCKEDIPSTEL